PGYREREGRCARRISAVRSSFIYGPQAIRPDILGDRLLQRSGVSSSVLTKPQELSTRAAPAATSHSCFGVSVNVASSNPADTRASLYATEPIGRTVNCVPSNCVHSPRLVSLLLARTTAPSRFLR